MIGVDTGPVRELSLDEAIRRTLATREEVVIARARAAAAAAAVRTARADRLPQVRSSLRYTRTFRSIFDVDGVPGGGPPFAPDTTLLLEERVRAIETALALGVPLEPGFAGELPFGLPNTWVAALTLDQVLYAGGEISARIDAAERRAEAARLEAEQAEADAALETRLAYYDAVLGRTLVAINEADLRRAGENLAIARVRFREGAVAELDVLRAEVDYDNLQPQLVDATDAYEAARLRLLELAGLPPDTRPVLLTGLCPPATDGGRPDRLPDPDAADPFFALQPDVLAARREADARRAEIRAARAAYRPRLDLFGNLGWQAFPDGVVPGFDDWREDWFAGAELRFPLYLGGRKDAAVDAARAEASAAEAEADRRLEAARTEYRQWIGEADRAWRETTRRLATLERADRIHRLVRLRYEEGVAIQLELLDARLALAQAWTNFVRSAHDYYAAIARAEHALGSTGDVQPPPASACPAPLADLLG